MGRHATVSIGERYGDFTIIGRGPRGYWLVRCDSGHEKLDIAKNLRNPALLQHCVRCSKEGKLTRREREVAELAVQGLTNKGIACALDISIYTTHRHLNKIYTKLGIAGRVQLAVWVTKENSKPTDN